MNEEQIKKITGARIQAAREAAGIETRSELDAICSLKNGRIGSYERAERLPDAGVLIKISKALNVSTDYLLGLAEQSAAIDAEPDLRPEQLTEAAAITNMIYSIARSDKKAPHARNCLPVISAVIEDLRTLQNQTWSLYNEIREQHPAFEMSDVLEPEDRRRIRVKAKLKDPEAVAFAEGEEAFMLQLRQIINETAGMIADRIIVDLGDQLSNNID